MSGRSHRRYFGVLAPNSPLRTAVTALALAATTSPPAPNPDPAAEPAYRRAARYTWVSLLARIDEGEELTADEAGSAGEESGAGGDGGVHVFGSATHSFGITSRSKFGLTEISPVNGSLCEAISTTHAAMPVAKSVSAIAAV